MKTYFYAIQRQPSPGQIQNSFGVITLSDPPTDATFIGILCARISAGHGWPDGSFTITSLSVLHGG